MRRAILFLDCDYCHESYSTVHSTIGSGHDCWYDTIISLEVMAFEDGWCHCLQEDTGKYQLMCHDCHATQSREAER